MAESDDAGPFAEDGGETAEEASPSSMALRELVRLAENVLLSQQAFAKEQDMKLRHLLTLAGGVLGVAVAGSGLVAGRPLGAFLGWIDLGVYGFLVPVTIAFVSSFTAFSLFALAYNGSRRWPYAMGTGWNPANLARAEEAGDSLPAIHRSTIRGAATWFRQNERMLTRGVDIRRAGTTLLLVSGASLASALIYAVGAIRA